MNPVKIKKYLLVLLILNSVVAVSCQDQNKQQMNEKFQWKETISCPSGYPVDVFRGGLESNDGRFTSLFSGIVDNGEWGSEGRSMSNGLKPLPDRLHVIWISYAEKTFYEVDTAIDREKIYRLFSRGYYTPSMNKQRPEPFKESYRTINVGFAPGGVVVIWVGGVGRQIEIGRYQAKKNTIPQEVIDKLKEEPVYSMLRPEYQESVMKNPGIVPPEVQQAHQGKPIPFGLWDSYRKPYPWKVNFVLPEEAILDEMTLDFYNGEEEILFGDVQINQFRIPQQLKWNTPIPRPVPKQISFRWKEVNKENCGGYVKFNEEEIFQAFEEVGSQLSPGEELWLTIRISQDQTDASVWLETKEKKTGLYQSQVKIF
ncbi:DUF2931 family protein [Apibacter sp. HY039]|uniref:DUF2931 family protein n=1 Tax=Apibacter sp. HY039 TaxID=2501476 RepID=UPI000FEC14C6|nr:DUF2931 family protein [Apibacter sp. HY039]